MKLSRQSLNIKFSYLAENSKFSRSNSYFSILTPTFLRDGFLNSCFQNPNENSAPECLSANAITKQFAFKKFMRWGVKSLLEDQNKCVNLSSFVQDFYPIIYYSCQLSFTTVPFPKCMLPVGQELTFIQVSRDIWAHYMFKQLNGTHVKDTGQ